MMRETGHETMCEMGHGMTLETVHESQRHEIEEETGSEKTGHGMCHESPEHEIEKETGSEKTGHWMQHESPRHEMMGHGI